MDNKIVLLAGTPNDSNRDYLPEEIKGSDMVVNENGNNSQVYPKNLKEYHECFEEGTEDTWYEYVPDSYDPAKKTPLVFSMHGGLMTGWGQAVYTSWTHVADREGFIVVFPDAPKRRFWTVEYDKELYKELLKPNPTGIYVDPCPEDIRENHDANLVLFLIRKMKEKYNIDESRIYMQGMSLGNAMTFMMARHYGNLFAAMAGSAGPSAPGLLKNEDGTLNNQAGPVNIWQSRMEIDNPPLGCSGTYEDAVVDNRDYWLEINGCEDLPRIRIDGESNLAFYRGKRADYVFRDIKNRDHGQTFDDAEFVWDYLFSGAVRKESGECTVGETELERQGDQISFAAAKDGRYVWVNNKKVELPGRSFVWNKLKYHGLGGKEIVRGSYVMVPAVTLAESFGFSYEISEEGARVVMTGKDGRELQFVRGCIGCTMDNRIHSMLCEAVERDGVLYLSAEWFCNEVCQLHTSVCSDTVYATDHYSVLSTNMARLIRDLLV